MVRKGHVSCVGMTPPRVWAVLSSMLPRVILTLLRRAVLSSGLCVMCSGQFADVAKFAELKQSFQKRECRATARKLFCGQRLHGTSACFPHGRQRCCPVPQQGHGALALTSSRRDARD